MSVSGKTNFSTARLLPLIWAYFPIAVCSVLPRVLRHPGAGRLTYILPTERDTFKSERYVARAATGVRPQFSLSREKAWLREAIAHRHTPIIAR